MIKHKKLLYLSTVLAMTAALLCGCDRTDHSDVVCVYGESALLQYEGQSIAACTLQEKSGEETDVVMGDTIDKGIDLRSLAEGKYCILVGGEPIKLDKFMPLEGYTLPIDDSGARNYWIFRKSGGRLMLVVEKAAKLPNGYYDVFIDVGHGGLDKGAVSGDLYEAEWNLIDAAYLRDLLTEAGLTVTMSREDGNITGGPEAEDNPYVKDARVDRAYRSNACYLISNHLNADSEEQAEEAGYQIFCSVRASLDWAREISSLWKSAGRQANDSNTPGLVEAGIFQRWQDDDPQSGTDNYFILRETGGNATGSVNYPEVMSRGAADIRRGAEGLLLEYAFLDNEKDMAYWMANYKQMIELAAEGCLNYWEAR